MTVANPTLAPAPDTPTPTQQLTGRVAGLRTRVGTGDLDRLLLIVGGLLLPLGVLLIVLAWLGASHTVLLFEQISYMISGGLLGLALVFIGGFVYFTYWQTLMVREGREQALRMEAVLERIEVLLTDSAAHAAVAGATDAAISRPSGTRSRKAPAGDVGATVLLATPTGTMLHRPECQVVTGRDDLRRLPRDAAGFEPCRICRPDLG